MSKNIILFGHKLARGGAEKMMSLLSLRLPKEIKTTIVLMEDDISYPYKGDIKILNILKPNFGLGIRIKAFLKRWQDFKKILRQVRPDYIITFSTTPALISVFLSSRAIVTFHSLTSRVSGGFFQRRRHKLLIKLVCRKAFKIVAVSQGVKKDLENNFKIKREIKVIYNFIDLDDINYLGQEKDLSKTFLEWKQKDLPILITAGTLREQKGYEGLLRIFSQVRKEIECKLVILGTGELTDYLLKISRRLGIEKDVLFLGFQKNPYKYFKNSGLFVFNPAFEGFGIVLIEAMACGLPIVCADCPFGPREILEPDSNSKYGLLIPMGKEDIFKEKILDLLENKELREKYRCLSLERAKDFDLKTRLPQWLDLLN